MEKSNIIRKEKTDTSLYIGLINNDEAIKYYFDTVIQPKVIENEQSISVPVIYGTPEKWKSMRKDGYYRDVQGKIMTPLIMYKRTNIEPVRDLSRILDANNPKVFQVMEQKYSNRNRYDRFSSRTNSIAPQYEIKKIVVPKYIKITYNCIIWTSLISQMNELIEAISYAESSYWGDMKTFRFYTTIGSFSDNNELGQGDDRIIKNSFDISLNGFIIPKSIQKELSLSNDKYYNKTKVVFSENVNL